MLLKLAVAIQKLDAQVFAAGEPEQSATEYS